MSDTPFYCPDIRENPQLSEQESHHCIKVLRMREGDRLTITDGRGYFYDCILTEAHPKHCVVSIEKEIFAVKVEFLSSYRFCSTKNMERNEWFVKSNRNRYRRNYSVALRFQRKVKSND